MQSIRVNDITIGEGIPKICSPLTGETVEELLSECALICESQADLVEWRVDFYKDALNADYVLETLAKIKEAVNEKPLIFSFRTAEEGGEKSIDRKYYLQLKKTAIASGHINLVDIELVHGEDVIREVIEVAKKHQVYTIISMHDFDKTPDQEEILNAARKAIKLGGDIPKLAIMPTNEEELLQILSINLQLKKEYPLQPFIIIAMGKLGVISRMSGEIFGSALTFAVVKKASAPGQFSIDQLKDVLQLIHEMN